MKSFYIDVFRNTPYSYQFHATGQVYQAWYEIASVAQGDTAYLELRQVNGKIAHIIDYILKSNSTNIEMAVYSGATFTPGTVRANWSSYNHRINKAPSVELYIDPVVPDLTGATERFKTKGYGAARGGQATFSEIAGNNFIEEMLEQDEDYIIAITNNGTAAREFFFHLAWYESGN